MSHFGLASATTAALESQRSRERAVQLVGGKKGSCGCLENENRRTISTRQGLSRNAPGTAEARTYNAYRLDTVEGALSFLLNSIEGLVADIGLCFPDKTLDRINNNDSYRAGNVRWATREEQGSNKRNNARE